MCMLACNVLHMFRAQVPEMERVSVRKRGRERDRARGICSLASNV